MKIDIQTIGWLLDNDAKFKSAYNAALLKMQSKLSEMTMQTQAGPYSDTAKVEPIKKVKKKSKFDEMRDMIIACIEKEKSYLSVTEMVQKTGIKYSNYINVILKDKGTFLSRARSAKDHASKKTAGARGKSPAEFILVKMANKDYIEKDVIDLLKSSNPDQVTAKARLSLDAANRDAYFRSTKPPGPLSVSVGDHVAWARYFLLATGRGPTDPSWQARGVVLELHSNGPWVLVQWAQGEPSLVASSNLAHDPGHHGITVRFGD